MNDSPQKASRPLVEARELSKVFPTNPGIHGTLTKKFVRAIDRVSIDVGSSEIVGLVGESGCGKSTLGRLLIHLEEPTSGTIHFDGRDITHLRGRALRRHRTKMQIIFQDPATSLNPRYTVRETLTEAIRAQRRGLTKREENAHLVALTAMVGLPTMALEKLPREFSGGEKQRIAIARTLAVESRFIVADEPISALDVSNQTQIVNLIESLRLKLGVSFLLISHDLDVVRFLSRRVAVMYLGRIVEFGGTQELFRSPHHPYTQSLIRSQLTTDPDAAQKLYVLPGDPPSPLDPPSGCHFHPRCPHAEAQCRLLEPKMREVAPSHHSKCHFDLPAHLPKPSRGIRITTRSLY